MRLARTCQWERWSSEGDTMGGGGVKEEKMWMVVAKSFRKFNKVRELNVFDVDGKDKD